jgi:transposase
MSVPIKLRDDWSAGYVRAHVPRCRDGTQVRRLLAKATILDGGSRSDAALIGGVTLQIVRDWVLRFNEGGPEGLATRKVPGLQTILGDGHRRALEEIIEAGPIPGAHGAVRWRIIDLVQWLWDEFKVSISKQALGGAPIMEKLNFMRTGVAARYEWLRRRACRCGGVRIAPPRDGPKSPGPGPCCAVAGRDREATAPGHRPRGGSR